jgi:hypothetical protein
LAIGFFEMIVECGEDGREEAESVNSGAHCACQLLYFHHPDISFRDDGSKNNQAIVV